MAFLNQIKASDSFRNSVERALLNPRVSMQVPGLKAELEKAVSVPSLNWVGSDDSISGIIPRNHQGVYRSARGEYFIDVVESIFYGKYDWWFPRVVVP
jgi:hypothetical protein